MRVKIENTAIRNFDSARNANLKAIIELHLSDLQEVNLYSVGASHTHKFPTAQNNLYIFNYATLRDGQEQPYHTEINDSVVFFGHAIPVKKMFHPAPGGELISDDEGTVVAQYFPQHNVLNILVDLFDGITDANLAIFDAIINKVKENVLERTANQSWKRAKDKTYVKARTKEYFDQLNERIVREARDRVEAGKQAIEQHKAAIISKVAELARNMAIADHEGDNYQERLNKLMEQIELTAQLDKVEDITFEGDFIVVKTNTLYITNPRNGRVYWGGKYGIKIHMGNSNVRFFKTDGRTFRGYWGGSDPHPHVNGGDGSACLGSVSATIAELCAATEFYALAIVCINFLETVNTDDAAGKKIDNGSWLLASKVDEKGNPLPQTADAEIVDDEDEDNESEDEN